MSDNFIKSFLTGDTHGIPNFAWLLIVAGGLGVGWYFKNRASNNQPASVLDNTAQTASGTGPVDTSGNSGNNNPNVQPTSKKGTVRQQIPTSTYDKQYNGVAVFLYPATPASGGVVAGFVPFGSSIDILSGPVQGKPYSATSGSSVYYLTPFGYINSQDVTIS